MMNEIFFADLKNDLVPLGRKEKKKERECHTIHQLELLLYSHFTLVLDNSGDVTMLYWSVISFFSIAPALPPVLGFIIFFWSV